MRNSTNQLAAALAFVVLGSAVPASAPSSAQTPPPRPSLSAETAFDAQKAAFMALPEATRVAIQQALVWLGFYNGVSDGVFGNGTRDAIVGWQKNAGAAVDGVLGPSLVRAALATGDKAREAAGFKIIDDPKTGARIGAPSKLLGRAVKFDFVSDGSGDLAGLYAKLTAATPARKVAYKAIKPDAFFVVAGQDGATKFYTRYEKNADATPAIRGFTFRYPAQATDLDRVAIAMANSFVAFPGSGPTPAASQPAAEALPSPGATALVIGPGRALTALKPEACPSPTIGGRPARFERSAASGLAVLAGDFGGAGETPRLGRLDGDLVALSASADRIAASAVSLFGDPARPVVVAALDTGAPGAPLFDRAGGLAGLVAPGAGEPQRIGGVALATPHAVIEASAIGAFLGGGAVEPAPPATPLTAGAIAARGKRAGRRRLLRRMTGRRLIAG